MLSSFARRGPARPALSLPLAVTAVLALFAFSSTSVDAVGPSAPNQMALDADATAPGVQALRSVSGTGSFRVSVQVTRAQALYKGLQWEFELPPGLAYDANIVKNDASGLDTCVDPNFRPGITNGSSTTIGGGAGCLLLDQSRQGVNFLGDIVSFGLHCVSDGTHIVYMHDLSGDKDFGSTLIDAQGVNKDTGVTGMVIVCGGAGNNPPPPPPGSDLCTVSGVVDGDTFDCQDGRRVRMLQIDAPDLGQCGGDWARDAQRNIFLTTGRVVRLEYDGAREDGQGRTLAAPIWRGNDNADYNLSIVMVYVGLAKAADRGDGNVKYLDWARASQVWASVAQWNMWAPGKTFNGGC